MRGGQEGKSGKPNHEAHGAAKSAKDEGLNCEGTGTAEEAALKASIFFVCSVCFVVQACSLCCSLCFPPVPWFDAMIQRLSSDPLPRAQPDPPSRHHRLHRDVRAWTRPRRARRGLARAPQRLARERFHARRRCDCAIGRVDGFEDAAAAARLRRLRLPQQPPGLARPRRGRLPRRGARRASSATARSASRCSSAPRPPASAPPRRPIASSRTAAFRRICADPHLHTPHSLGAVRRSALGIARPLPDRRHRVLVEREGLRQGRAPDPSRPGRRGDRRRRRHAVRQRAVRLQRAGTGLAGAVPAVRRRAPRHLDRRGRRLRPARTRRRAASRRGCSATANPATRTTCRRRIPKASARAARWPTHLRARPRAGPGRLHQPARHRDAEERRGRSRAWSPTLFPRRRAPVRPRAGPATRSARPASSKRPDRLLAIEHGSGARHARIRATPDPLCGPQLALDNEERAIRVALSNSFGFGGNNCILAFGHAEGH